ncbi:hypothetical protein ACHAW5_007898 [Stephanodiscus triporus]|uniref:Coiled-coil domain-containing protein 40 n=1 Tax=Stephanodiscus triporus TaxID=2934178 RepID=A0ABD3PIG1_9STRA
MNSSEDNDYRADNDDNGDNDEIPAGASVVVSRSSQDEGGGEYSSPSSKAEMRSYSKEYEEEGVSDLIQANPMLERIRLTLHQQLLQTRDRVKLELIEKERALKETKKLREDAGIELYGVQQQLSRLQSSLKSVEELYGSVSKERVEGQEKSLEARQGYAKKAKSVEDLRDEASRRREELDSLLEKIRQARNYNDAMKSEVAVTRTVANKTGEDLKARAKGKLDQDAYIDGLNRQVTKLEDEIALAKAQMRAQKEQSADADKMIRETRGALDALAGEQRQLVQQWNASVVALGRRDQALYAATTALRKVQDSIKDAEDENARLERDIASLRESIEAIEVSRDRLDNEIVFAENNATKTQSNLVALSETFTILQEALKNANQEEMALVSAISKIEGEISAMNHKCELLIRERQAVENEISTARHEQMNMSEVAQSLAKQEKYILAKIHDKEIESANILNEIARLDIDRLNTQAHNLQLEEKLNEELAVLKGAEATINEKETELRRCIDEIEKKTIRVAKLNREYNKMVEDCEDEEPLGPLEATIKNLSKQVDRESSEIRSLQREWLTRQTELINTTRKTNTLQEKDSESTARLGVLRQKLLRLNQENHTNESEFKSIEYKSRGLHTDMTRLNDLIEQNRRRRAEWENKIAVNAMEFERELSELDQRSIKLDGQMAEVQSNRAKILAEIKDNEEQIKVWEKKIQVEKETHEELHTSKDAIDTKGMEREIKKMKRILESLTITQEQLLRDMELAIHRREDIAIKYKNTKHHGNNSKQQNITKGEQVKKIQHATSKLERLESCIQDATQSVAVARDDLSAIKMVLKATRDQLHSSAHMRKSLEKELAELEFAKTRIISMCGLYKEVIQRYESLDKGDVPPVNVSARAEFEVEKQMLAAKARMEMLSNIITGLSMKFDEYQEIFDKMSEILHAIPN